MITGPAALRTLAEERDLVAEAKRMETGEVPMDAARYDRIRTLLFESVYEALHCELGGPYGERLADLEHLLRGWGSSDEWRADVAAVHRSREALDRLRYRLTDEHFEQYGAVLVDLEHLANEALEAALRTEESAAAHGWRFDSQVGRLVEDHVRQRHRTKRHHAPEHLLTAAVAHVCERWKIFSNTVEVREKIALVLAGQFGDDDLRVGSSSDRSPLWGAVSNYLRRLSREEVRRRRRGMTSLTRVAPEPARKPAPQRATSKRARPKNRR